MSDNPRLLVVDDEPVICRACHRVFSRQGFDVEESTDAREGLNRAREGDYSAILLDIKMPAMDGLQFLAALREEKPDVPVMIMTGYPSIPNAVSAVRLGASDYITKPFTPEEITQTVRRILANRPASSQEPAATEPAPADGTAPQTRGRLFLNESWLQLEADGAARLGAVLPHSQEASVRAVRLPPVGEVVYQGLPLAGLTMADGAPVIVPSPVSGVVASVNELLNGDPSILLRDPCGEGWIASICTTRLEEEMENCRPRRVILINADGATVRDQRKHLESLGCEVHVIEDWEELAPMAHRLEYGVLVFDAACFGIAGPDRIRQVNAEAPGLKVVVIGVTGSPGRQWETTYREQKIFYYAVKPFADNEIVDILDAAFRSQRHPRRRPAHWNAPSESISGIRITNRNRHKVQLLAAPGLLWRNNGLGRKILQKLGDRAFPIAVTVGDRDISPSNVLREAGTHDRVMVLLARDMGRLPGSLVRDTMAEYVSASKENAGKVATLAVQADKDDGKFVGFDDRTTEALAEHIVQEMASY